MKHIVIKTKRKIFGNLLGRYVSKFKGSGVDFKEIREYVFGEDAKKIDWKISAKFQKPYVKEFEEERELNIVIFVLASATMFFGSKRLKTELVSEIVAILGFSAVKFDNRVSLIIYSDEEILHLKPTKTQKGVLGMIDKVYSYDFLKKSCSDKFLDYVNRFKKSILFIIGDFYFHPMLKSKHETYVIWVRDKFEENPEPLGEVDLISPFDLKKVRAHLNQKNVQKYIEELKNKDLVFENFLKEKKIKYKKIYTDEDPFFKLAELLR